MADITTATYAHALDQQDELAHFRDQFIIEDPDLIYLDGNSLGRLPKKTAQAMRQAVEQTWGSRLIRGWNEGLVLFKKGGKGTLYIPGFLAYGADPNGPARKPFAPLIFDVEILEVSDKPISQIPMGQ